MYSMYVARYMYVVYVGISEDVSISWLLVDDSYACVSEFFSPVIVTVL